ncbi:60S ribosomal protein L17-B [Pseudozyma hubeiensis SY62]|uniref:60S ribosomal protein L17-B n=1 Tax=Pseudozyma hubeiensis (strain SY62) TaxID=1305764 RepID=R9PEF7_PSEHS|nr:60S ribosomal protein L17-B [Pseudozyma hubeiensis SY62]GAC99736.1 60S ribosomal protein L17-B [Pseudozyma hubeiensis SY62]
MICGDGSGTTGMLYRFISLLRTLTPPRVIALVQRTERHLLIVPQSSPFRRRRRGRSDGCAVEEGPVNSCEAVKGSPPLIRHKTDPPARPKVHSTGLRVDASVCAHIEFQQSPPNLCWSSILPF